MISFSYSYSYPTKNITVLLFCYEVFLYILV